MSAERSRIQQSARPAVAVPTKSREKNAVEASSGASASAWSVKVSAGASGPVTLANKDAELLQPRTVTNCANVGISASTLSALGNNNNNNGGHTIVSSSTTDDELGIIDDQGSFT